MSRRSSPTEYGRCPCDTARPRDSHTAARSRARGRRPSGRHKRDRRPPALLNRSYTTRACRAPSGPTGVTRPELRAPTHPAMRHELAGLLECQQPSSPIGRHDRRTWHQRSREVRASCASNRSASFTRTQPSAPPKPPPSTDNSQSYTDDSERSAARRVALSLTRPHSPCQPDRAAHHVVAEVICDLLASAR